MFFLFILLLLFFSKLYFLQKYSGSRFLFLGYFCPEPPEGKFKWGEIKMQDGTTANRYTRKNKENTAPHTRQPKLLLNCSHKTKQKKNKKKNGPSTFVLLNFSHFFFPYSILKAWLLLRINPCQRQVGSSCNWGLKRVSRDVAHDFLLSLPYNFPLS